MNSPPDDVNNSVDWVNRRLSRSPTALTSLVPRSFKSYVRILHPFQDAVGRRVRWAPLARSVGIDTADNLMWSTELERALAGGVLTGSGYEEPLPGPLEPTELKLLVSALALQSHKINDECICAFWNGWTELTMSTISGSPQPADNALGTKGELRKIQDKSYRLVQRSLSYFTEGRVRFVDSPDLMWPIDRKWFLRSDVSLMSSFLGSSSDPVKVLEEPALEAIRLSEDAEIL